MINLERTTGTRRLGWVSLLGALLVPIMMAAGFLAATWNSSSRWDKVQAAIVNNDEPAKINGRTVPLGRQLASRLVTGGDASGDHRQKQNFDWVISDAGDASAGLADGRYAAVVTIPSNFSRAATSYSANKGDRAEHATLDVRTSKVSGVTDSAVAQAISTVAVSSLNNELTKQYLGNLYLGFNQTQHGIKKSADGASGLADGASQLRDGIDKSATGASKLATGMKQLATGTSKLSDGIDRTDTGVGRLSSGITGLHNGIKQTNTGVTKLDAGVGRLADGMDTYTSGATSYAKGVKKYTDGVSKLTDSLRPYAEGVGTYADGVDQYAQGAARFADSVGPAAESARKAVTSDEATNQACTQAGFVPGSSECQIFTAGMKAGAQGVADGVEQGLVGTTGNPGLAIKIENGAQQLRSGSQQVKSGSTRLSGAAGRVGDAGDQLATGAKGLAHGAQKIDKGLSGLHDGTGKLATGTGKLEKGAKTLDIGARQLATGMGKLDDAGRQLATGTAQSATGAGRLSGGLAKLADGGDQLADGADQLAGGLHKAADRIPTYSGSDRKQLASVVSAPVHGDQPDGLFANETTTTLLTALALWIGGLATYLIVRAIGSDAFGSQKSSVRLALEGVAPGVIIGALQATILSVMVGVLLDVPLSRTVGLLGFSIFAAVTFAVLNQALVAWLGGIGRFIAIAVVVMAAAGSLTNALPGFFATVRPYLPTTPALDGVRMIVTDGSSAGSQIAVLLGWLVIGGLASVLAVSRRRVAAVAVPVVAG